MSQCEEEIVKQPLVTRLFFGLSCFVLFCLFFRQLCLYDRRALPGLQMHSRQTVVWRWRIQEMMYFMPIFLSSFNLWEIYSSMINFCHTNCFIFKSSFMYGCLADLGLYGSRLWIKYFPSCSLPIYKRLFSSLSTAWIMHFVLLMLIMPCLKDIWSTFYSKAARTDLKRVNFFSLLK